MSAEFHLIPEQAQSQQQKYSTLLWNANPEIPSFLHRDFVPTFNQPETSKVMIFVGESGAGKGPVRNQGIAALREDPGILKVLDTKGRKLKIHSLTTSDVVKEGLKRIPLSTPWGTPTDDEMAEMTRMANYGLAKAEVLLPYTDPDSVHLLIEEFTAVATPFNVGTDIVKRQGRSIDTAVIFVASHAKIQARTYKKRSEMDASLQQSDPKVRREQQLAILRKHKTRYDVNPDASIYTSGTHDTIKLVCDIVNKQMYKAYTQTDPGHKMYLPVTTPDELVQEIRALSGDDLKSYFDHLTEFTKGNMTSNPIRQHLLDGYYTYLAKEWGLVNYLVVKPQFIEDEWIEDYPGMSGDLTLPLGVFIEDRYQMLPERSDVFIATP